MDSSTMIDRHATFSWLVELGIDRAELSTLSPCVPGEFTLSETYYVNSGSPRIVYRGTQEGTLPLVAGRWYILPHAMIKRYQTLTRETLPVAAAVRLTRS